jgi:hypothetical protein
VLLFRQVHGAFGKQSPPGGRQLQPVQQAPTLVVTQLAVIGRPSEQATTPHCASLRRQAAYAGAAEKVEITGTAQAVVAATRRRKPLRSMLSVRRPADSLFVTFNFLLIRKMINEGVRVASLFGRHGSAENVGRG